LDSEKRLWLALGLSTVIIVVYTLWMQKMTARNTAAEQAAAEQAASPAGMTPAGVTPAGEAGNQAVPAQPGTLSEDYRARRRKELADSRTGTAPAVTASVASPRPGSEIVIENESFVARVTTAGCRLLSWELKPYRAMGSTAYEELVPLAAGKLAEGPLSVVLADFPESAGAVGKASLSRLKVGKDGIEQTLPGRGGETVLLPAEGGKPAMGEMAITQNLPGNRRLVRRVRIPAHGYVADWNIELDGPAPEWLEVVWGPRVGLTADEEAMLNRQATYQDRSEAVLLTHKDILRQGDAKKLLSKQGEAPLWVAMSNKYFTAAMISPNLPSCEGVMGTAGSVATAGEPDRLRSAIRFRLVPGARRVRIPLKIYAGPQEYGSLAAAGSRLEKVLDFGFFGSIALPLLHMLKFMARYVHNYGVAIILLTLLVRLVLWFPSQWGMNQMKRMQEIQPKVKFVTEQYKDDPKRKQEQIMQLYKEHKVNPVGGCLPLLLQIPVFFALYSVLVNAVELRGAPFALWIQDLSVRDPIYVLPALVGVTMWIQQAITPVAGDPQQAKMMRWMSLVFCFMFMKMPSGLMLYWLAQNITQICQQWYTNKKPAAAAGRI